MSDTGPYETYQVQRRQKEPLLEFVLGGLRSAGCLVLHHSEPDQAPFQLSAVLPNGARLGLIVYAFYANSKVTRNRPSDEWRFQIKYGSDFSREHEIWQDPFQLYTTLFLGISPEEGFFVGADPVFNNPTWFSVSKEFKDEHVEEIRTKGWAVWERETRPGTRDPRDAVEVLVGGKQDRFLDYVLFEREALGEDQGHRNLLAIQAGKGTLARIRHALGSSDRGDRLKPSELHRLEREFELDREQILTLIDNAPRLRTAVRGWVAEEHLFRAVSEVPGVRCERIEEDGRPDLQYWYQRRAGRTIECKNVLRGQRKAGMPVVDFQKTRAAKGNPCSRYYRRKDFDLVAACLHPQTETWEFRLRRTADIGPHKSCKGRLNHRLPVDEDWVTDLERALDQASRA